MNSPMDAAWAVVIAASMLASAVMIAGIVLVAILAAWSWRSGMNDGDDE